MQRPAPPDWTTPVTAWKCQRPECRHLTVRRDDPGDQPTACERCGNVDLVRRPLRSKDET